MSIFQWGSYTTLAEPKADGVRVLREFVGSYGRLADATLRVDRIAEKARIEVEWIGLSAAERSALRTAWVNNAYAAKSLIVPGVATFTVMAAGGWQEAVDYVNGTTDYHRVRITFLEV